MAKPEMAGKACGLGSLVYDSNRLSIGHRISSQFQRAVDVVNEVEFLRSLADRAHADANQIRNRYTKNS